MPDCSISIKEYLIRQWFEQTEGWVQVRATDEGIGQPVTVEEVLTLSDGCSWIEIEDAPELPYVKEGSIHRSILEIGWGIPLDAYRKHPGSKAIFFHARKHVNHTEGESK